MGKIDDWRLLLIDFRLFQSAGLAIECDFAKTKTSFVGVKYHPCENHGVVY